MFIWYFLFWSAVDSEQQQRRTWYSWCNPSVVNVLNMAEVEEERGMRAHLRERGDGKLRVILCAARRGQSSYSHSPQSSPPSDLCCSLDKCKIGSRVKSYISSSIHIYWLQSTHDACSAVIWLIKRGLCIHSITNSRLLASTLRCIDGIPYQEEFVFAALRPLWCDRHNAEWGGIVIWHLWQIQTQRHGIFVRTGNTTRLLSFIVSLNIVITSQDKHDE